MSDLSNQEQAAVVDAKELLGAKQHVLEQVGQLKAFDFMAKLATVANLKTLQEIKDSKDFVGLTYTDEQGNLATVANWDQFCTHILATPKRTIDDKLLNLRELGEQFYESSQALNLGSRDLRKLRQLDDDQKALVINSEAVDMQDENAVKELIEELTEQHNKEKENLESKVKEQEQTISAKEKVLSGRHAELEAAFKTIEKLEKSQKRESQPWHNSVLELNMEATTLAAQILENLDKLLELNHTIQTEELNEKHSDLAMEQLAQVQIHCVDQVFLAANTLSIETREMFPRHINAAHAMYSEEELIALTAEIEERG